MCLQGDNVKTILSDIYVMKSIKMEHIGVKNTKRVVVAEDTFTYQLLFLETKTWGKGFQTERLTQEIPVCI